MLWKKKKETAPAPVADIIALRIIAEDCYQGYELLQELLSLGFKYGEMNIFHRHEEANGHGKILFSLASATEPGTFDLENMGGFSCKGLSLFMRLGGEDIRATLELMLETAKELINDLGGTLWDDKYRLLDDISIKRWHERVNCFENNQYSYDLFDEEK